MAKPFRLRPRRHLLRRADLLRHDDHHFCHRQWTPVIRDGPEIRYRFLLKSKAFVKIAILILQQIDHFWPEFLLPANQCKLLKNKLGNLG
jgi:hypothetical protein